MRRLALALLVVTAWIRVDAFAQSDPLTEGLEGLTGTANSARELLENIPEELPAGVDVKIRAEQMSVTERSIYGSAGAAELTAAFLLRGNKSANQALAKATQELGSRPVVVAPRTGIPPSTNKVLRRLGAPGRLVSALANLSALKGMVSPQRLRSLGSKLGTAGRFSTRQILYAHGTYSTVASVTGYKARVDVEVSEDMIPIAPLAGPTGVVDKPVVPVETVEDERTVAPAVIPAAPLVAVDDDDKGDAVDSVPVVVEPREVDVDDPPEPPKGDSEWVMDNDPLGAVGEIVEGIDAVCDPSTGCDR